MHYKQCAPESTVERLKNILNDMGVEVEEMWQSESSIGTYALRLTFKGTNIGTNGKGTSKEYARASAYAEFFERYQNDILGPIDAIIAENESEAVFSDLSAASAGPALAAIGCAVAASFAA